MPAATGPAVPWDVRFAGAGAGREVQPGDATVQVTPRPPTSPSARPRSRPKKRTRAWMIVAVPVVVAATAGGIVLSTTGNGGNEPLAGGNQPTVVRTSHSGGHGKPASTQVTSSPRPGGAPPPQTVGVGPGPPSVHLAGVTVRHAQDLTRRPVVSTRGASPPATLQVKNLVVGRGAAATPTSTVTVRYVDVLYADGTTLDSSWPQPSRFDLNSKVAGFRRGVGGDGTIAPMRVGGRRLIVVPPNLGYGDQQQGNTPPNSTLVFVVDLKAVG
jgi:peptidylprolyl isomerase